MTLMTVSLTFNLISFLYSNASFKVDVSKDWGKNFKSQPHETEMCVRKNRFETQINKIIKMLTHFALKYL